MGTPIPQVGAIPFRRAGERLEVLLIRSKHLGWAIPKGHREPGLTAREMAEIETLEEAGAIGRVVGRSVGHFTYRKNGTPARVKVFVLEVTEVLDAWLEQDRPRCWLPIDEAAERVDHPEIARLIRDLRDLTIAPQRQAG